MALEFKIELTGNFAGALEKSAEATDKASGATSKHRKELELFESEVGKAKGEFAGFAIDLEAFAKGGSLFTFDLAEGLRGAVELAGALVEKIIDLGKEAVGVAGKVQDIDLAIRLNVGDERAGAIDELAESFEKTTRFDAGDIKQALLPLLKQGVGDVETLDTIATIGADLAARSGGGIGEVQETIAAFAGIFQRGRLKPAQLAQFGIQASDYFAELGATFGVSAAQAEMLAKKGKLTGDQLARVAAQMVAQKQGGAIGGPALEGATTMGATLDRLANLKENLFERLAHSPAMAKVQAVLDRFIATMNGEAGDKLIAQLGGVFEQIATWLSPERITAFVNALASVGDHFETIKNVLGEVLIIAQDFAVIWTGTKLMNALGGLQTLFEGGLLNAMKGGLTALRTGLNSALSPVAALTIAFEAWRYAFEKIGETVQELGGLKQVAKDFGDWISGDNDSGVAHDAANANSPEWKKRLAANAIQTGGGIPMMAAGGIVSGPTLAVVGEAGPEAIVPLDRAGGLGNQISYAPVYQVSGSNAADLRAELEQIERASRLEFKKIVDELLAS